MHSHKEERIGETFIISEMIIFSLFPIIINYSTKIIPPIFFAGTSTLLATIAVLFHLLVIKKTKEIFNKKAFPYILGITAFVIIIPSTLIYLGTKLTSGINTSILLQTEIFFTLLFCSLFFHEKITKQKIISSLAIFFGALLVLYNGQINLNFGDLLILIGVSFFPFGNMFAKKALNITNPSAIIFVRSFIGGIALIIISLLFEKNITEFEFTKKTLLLIAANGFLIMALSKILWYEGLRRLEISKATTLGMSYPALSIIFAVLFLKEIPTYYQIFGLLLTMIGVYTITKKEKRTEPIESQISA